MTDDKITDLQWNAILDSIDSENCIPFLGAGVNVSRKDPEYKGLPLGNQVALRLVRSFVDQKILNDEQLDTLTNKAAEDVRLRLAQAIAGRGEQPMTPEEVEQHLRNSGPLPNLLRAALPDLSRVALEVQMGAGFNFLWRRLREILPDASVKPSPMLESLAALKKPAPGAKHGSGVSPFQLIVTTNYDRLLERAFKASGLNYVPVVQYTSGIEIENEKDTQKKVANPQGTIIYKIHGTFVEGDEQRQAKGVILTEEDYIEFLSILGDQEKGVPPLISSKMRLGGTILFLGYGLQDWDFRIIYKSMIESIEPNLRPQSFAIQKNPPDYLVRYWMRKNVDILNVDLYEFAEELRARWEALSSSGRTTS